MKNFRIFLFSAVVSLILFSCTSTRQSQYFQGVFDTTQLSVLNIHEPIVQKGDLLAIVVYSDNPEATAIYNQPILASNTTSGVLNASGTPSQGYLVDSEGNIQFQGLGTIHVEGLSRRALSDTLLGRLSVYLTNAYTSIRFLNYKVTIIGEVLRPGIYTIPGERVNMLEAIGLAGEFSIYGRKDNVLIIREVNGKREFGRMDLRSPEAFTSPYYYLQQNDIVVIDQNKNKQSGNDQTISRNIGLGASIISTIAIIISILR